MQYPFGTDRLTWPGHAMFARTVRRLSISIIIGICAATFSAVMAFILGVALTHWTSLARLIRGEVLQLKEQIYIKTARKLGKSNLYIAMRHMTPHLFPQFLVGLVLLFPHAILVLVPQSTSYLDPLMKVGPQICKGKIIKKKCASWIRSLNSIP